MDVGSPKKKRRSKVVQELVVADYQEAKTVIKTLKDIDKEYVVTEQTGDCLYHAYLQNIQVPEGYTISHFRKQLTAFALRNVKFFRDKIHTEKESLESYLRNLSSGRSFGDRHSLEIATLMWNTRVSIVSPQHPVINIWHGQDLADSHIVICWNGNNHYVGTRFVDEPHTRLRSIDNVIHIKHLPKPPKESHTGVSVKLEQMDISEPLSVDPCVEVSDGNCDAKLSSENCNTKSSSENCDTKSQNVVEKSKDFKVDNSSAGVDESVKSGLDGVQHVENKPGSSTDFVESGLNAIEVTDKVDDSSSKEVKSSEKSVDNQKQVCTQSSSEVVKVSSPDDHVVKSPTSVVSSTECSGVGDVVRDNTDSTAENVVSSSTKDSVRNIIHTTASVHVATDENGNIISEVSAGQKSASQNVTSQNSPENSGEIVLPKCDSEKIHTKTQVNPPPENVTVKNSHENSGESTSRKCDIAENSSLPVTSSDSLPLRTSSAGSPDDSSSCNDLVDSSCAGFPKDKSMDLCAGIPPNVSSVGNYSDISDVENESVDTKSDNTPMSIGSDEGISKNPEHDENSQVKMSDENVQVKETDENVQVKETDVTSDASTMEYSQPNSPYSQPNTPCELYSRNISNLSPGPADDARSISSIAEDAIGSAQKLLSRKRESRSTSKVSKKVRLNLDIESQMATYKVLSEDLVKMERYVCLAKVFQTKLKRNLLELGVSEGDLDIDIDHEVVSTESRLALVQNLGEKSDQGLNENLDEKSDQGLNENLGEKSDQGLNENLDESGNKELNEINTKSDDEIHSVDSMSVDNTYDDPQMIEMIVVSPQEETKDEVVFQDFTPVITLTDSPESSEHTKTVLQFAENVRKSVQKVVEAKSSKKTKTTITEVQNVVKKELPSDNDEDCVIIVSSDENSDMEINVVHERNKGNEVFDLSNIKKEHKDITEEDIVENTPSMKNVLKKMIEKNEDGRYLCPLKCGKDFKSVANMFKHLDTEVCSKPVNERNNLVCSIKQCTHTCVTKTAMKAHELGHFGIRPYECPVKTCDKTFVQPSSVSNHKHLKHADIYGGFPVAKKKKSSESGAGTSGTSSVKKKKKKKVKKSEKKSHVPSFSSDESDKE